MRDTYRLREPCLVAMLNSPSSAGLRSCSPAAAIGAAGRGRQSMAVGLGRRAVSSGRRRPMMRVTVPSAAACRWDQGRRIVAGDVVGAVHHALPTHFVVAVD